MDQNEVTGEDDIIELPHVAKACELLKSAYQAQGFGVIYGVNGAGKSVTLRYLARKAASLGLPGEVLSYRCCYSDGQTRGIKDLLGELGVGGALLTNGSSVSLAMAIRLTQRKLMSRRIHTILLDEAPNWTLSALGGFCSMVDVCREKGHSVTVIFAGALNPDLWIGAIPMARSRTLHMQLIPVLDDDSSAGVLSSWGGTFKEFAEALDAKKADAIKSLKLIHSGTEGNLRRLAFFARLHAGLEVTPKSVKVVLAQMRNSPEK